MSRRTRLSVITSFRMTIRPRIALFAAVGGQAAYASFFTMPAFLPSKVVGVKGFEPSTSWSQTRRSTRLSYTPKKEGKQT